MNLKTITVVFLLLLPTILPAQVTLDEYSNLLQHYYKKKDKKLLKKSLEILNSPDLEFKRVRQLLTGFYSGLFSVNAGAKKEFSENIEKFKNERVKSLLKELTTTHIDSVYAKLSLSPEYNDVCWASFFATGDTKFLDKIIANIPLADDRVNMNLFFTGSTAKWSLCSNAKDDKIVKAHLAELKDKALSAELLNKEPSEYKEEIVAIIKAQRAKGLWKER